MSGSIRVRAAEEEQDKLFFYIGFSPYPGKDAVKESLASGRLYRPSKLHRNSDESLTVEFHQSSFGFAHSERHGVFSTFFSEIVVPRLIEAAGAPVEADEDILQLPLQKINTQTNRTNPNHVMPVPTLSIGSVSLFSPEVELVLLAQRKEEENSAI